MAALAQTILSPAASVAAYAPTSQMIVAGSSTSSRVSLKPAFLGTFRGLTERTSASISKKSPETASTVVAFGYPGWGGQAFPGGPGGPSRREVEEALKQQWERMQQAAQQQQQQQAQRSRTPRSTAPWAAAPDCAQENPWSGSWGSPQGNMEQGGLNLNQLLSDFFGGISMSTMGWGVQEQQDAWVLNIQLPGYGPEEVQVDVENDTILSIRAQPAGQTSQAEGFGSSGKRKGFQTRLPIPDFINAAAVSADLSKGVLQVTLSKKKPVQEKQSNVRRVQVRQVKTQPGVGRKEDVRRPSSGSDARRNERRPDGLGGIFL